MAKFSGMKPGDFTGHIFTRPGGLFYSGDFWDGEVAHELRLLCCWSMLVIGSLGAM